MVQGWNFVDDATLWVHEVAVRPAPNILGPKATTKMSLFYIYILIKLIFI